MRFAVWLLNDEAIRRGVRHAVQFNYLWYPAPTEQQIRVMAEAILEGDCPEGHGPLDRERGGIPLGDVRAEMARCHACATYFRAEAITA